MAIDRIQREREAHHFIARSSGQATEELFEALQQVDLAEDHVQRQANAQLLRQLIQA
ncbi:hypothetical protein D3C73_1596310 [compost metagenome]